MLRALFIILGALGIGDTIAVSMYSNMNAGTVLPAILGAPLLVIGLFFPAAVRFFSGGFGLFIKWLLMIGYASYMLILIIFVPMIYKEGREAPKPGADALIVLGCGVRGERVSLTLERRLIAAMEYAEANPDTMLILSGGQGGGEAITEAEAMRRYLSARGIPEERLRIEDKSDSTYTNFQYSKAIIDAELGPEASVVFVTTRFHVLRAEKVAQGLGIAADGIGAPGVGYIEPNNYMRESLVMIYYLLAGRI